MYEDQKLCSWLKMATLLPNLDKGAPCQSKLPASCFSISRGGETLWEHSILQRGPLWSPHYAKIRCVSFLLLLQQITTNSGLKSTNVLAFSSDMRLMRLKSRSQHSFLESLGRIIHFLAFSSFYGLPAFLGSWPFPPEMAG